MFLNVGRCRNWDGVCKKSLPTKNIFLYISFLCITLRLPDTTYFSGGLIIEWVLFQRAKCVWLMLTAIKTFHSDDGVSLFLVLPRNKICVLFFFAFSSRFLQSVGGAKTCITNVQEWNHEMMRLLRRIFKPLNRHEEFLEAMRGSRSWI